MERRLATRNTTDRYEWGYPGVAPSVGVMSYQRLAYDDQDSAPKMHEDCTACGSRIQLPAQRLDGTVVTATAPSLEFEDFPREVRKSRIEVSEAAAHLGARLHLHLD